MEKLSLGVLKISSFLEFESHHASIIGKATTLRRTTCPMTQPTPPRAAPSPTDNGPRLSWRDTWRAYVEPASLRMFALGFSAGLPLLLVLGTLSFRLREAGIDRTTIGYLSWVGLAYGIKWVWSPLVDRLPIPRSPGCWAGGAAGCWSLRS